MPKNIKPFCFILMPFGIKKDENGHEIDFDKVYALLIKPAIKAAQLEPIRADEEVIGGIIHKTMYERLILCDYAIADLTLGNANVFYELGIRHGARPHTTISIFKNKTQLPFDVSFLRAIAYDMSTEESIERAKNNITKLLKNARYPHTDSPLYQTFNELKPTEISHLKTEVFRDQVNYNEKIKTQLELARESGDVQSVYKTLPKIRNLENGVIIDLFLTFRAVGDYKSMVKLVDEIKEPLKSTKMIQEQLGFALNRIGKRDQAEKVLIKVINKFGKNSETYGLLGRVYKDKWQEALKLQKKLIAKGYLNKAIDSYHLGYKIDIRDVYPGINAITLLDCANRIDEKNVLLPVVKYAVLQNMNNKPDYGDYATLLELAVIENKKTDAIQHLQQLLVLRTEQWETLTTANNLKLIKSNRASRGASVNWIDDLIVELEQKTT